MLATIIAFASLGQLSPDTILDERLHDARFFKRVQVAQGQAEQWIRGEPDRLFPMHFLSRLSVTNPAKCKRILQLKRQAIPILRKAAYQQICDAYDISEKEFQAILRNQDVRRLRHERERIPNARGDTARIRMATRQWGLEPTRFDPAKVRLPEKFAREIGYKNPPEPEKPDVFSSEARAKGARDPNRPQDSEGPASGVPEHSTEGEVSDRPQPHKP